MHSLALYNKVQAAAGTRQRARDAGTRNTDFKLECPNMPWPATSCCIMLPTTLLFSTATLLATTPSPPPPTRIFIGGLGYCGTRIASSFHDTYPNAIISGTVRSTERRDAILTSPPSWLTGSVHVLELADAYAGLSSDGVADLTSASHVIQTVAPIADYDRDPLLALHGDTLSSSNVLQYVGYISSTGVYGDYSGEWVTEESELRCIDAKSMARVVAEQEWGKLEKEMGDAGEGPRVDCFRCGGIYGPGRGPLFSSIASLNETLVDDDAQESSGGEEQPTKYVNRILVDDICGALLAAVASDRPRCGGRAYNLVDDDPAPRKAVVTEARRLLVPPNSSEDTSQANSESKSVSKAATKNTRRRISRATGNKRCDNRRLKEEYKLSLKAPTYREGLALLLENSDLQL